MEMSCLVQSAGQTLTADPDHIRRYVVIVGKDQPGACSVTPDAV
jgi:hypothetical protein